jgi:hypothetical protein
VRFNNARLVSRRLARLIGSPPTMNIPIRDLDFPISPSFFNLDYSTRDDDLVLGRTDSTSQMASVDHAKRAPAPTNKNGNLPEETDFVYKRPKISELPLNSSQRTQIDGLISTFKRVGEFDKLRKQIYAQFMESVCLLYSEVFMALTSLRSRKWI